MDQFLEFLADPVSVLGVGQSGLDGLEKQLPGEWAWAAVRVADLERLQGAADEIVGDPFPRPGIAFEGLIERNSADLVPLAQRDGLGEFAQVLGAEGMIPPRLASRSAPPSRHESTMSVPCPFRTNSEMALAANNKHVMLK
jgi:hypothetical protein